MGLATMAVNFFAGATGIESAPERKFNNVRHLIAGGLNDE
jgi:hypothetical protein